MRSVDVLTLRPKSWRSSDTVVSRCCMSFLAFPSSACDLLRSNWKLRIVPCCRISWAMRRWMRLLSFAISLFFSVTSFL